MLEKLKELLTHKRLKTLIIAGVAGLTVFTAAAVLRPVSLIGMFYRSESIAAVKTSPAYYKNGLVTIAGRVVEYKAHMGMNAFKVADKTGDITVFYDSAATSRPAVGSYVVIRGSLEEINLPGTRMGTYLKETVRVYCSQDSGGAEEKNNTI